MFRLSSDPQYITVTIRHSFCTPEKLHLINNTRLQVNRYPLMFKFHMNNVKLWDFFPQDYSIVHSALWQDGCLVHSALVQDGCLAYSAIARNDCLAYSSHQAFLNDNLIAWLVLNDTSNRKVNLYQLCEAESDGAINIFATSVRLSLMPTNAYLWSCSEYDISLNAAQIQYCSIQWHCYRCVHRYNNIHLLGFRRTRALSNANSGSDNFNAIIWLANAIKLLRNANSPSSEMNNTVA